VNQGDRSKISLDISFLSLFKIIATAVLVLFVAKLVKLGLLIFLGLLLAVSLDPLVRKLRRYKLSKSLAITVIALSMTGLIVLIGFILVPSIFNQVTNLIKNVPLLKKEIVENLAKDNNMLSNMARGMLENPKIPATDVLMTQAWSFVNMILEGLSEVFLVLIFSIYLLIDGRRAFKWICDFFSSPTRTKLQITAEETSELVFSYVTAQVLTSVLSGLFAYIILLVLRVPGALTLAVMAGLLDIVPILGFFLAVIPAMLLAFTISPMSGVYVFAFYLFYHGLENYLLAPLIYGNRLKVSSLVILLALLIAGIVGGILGALAVLPVVASYPIIERIWLVKYLGRHVTQKHSEKTELNTLSEQVTVWNEEFYHPSRVINKISEHFADGIKKTILIVEDDFDIRSTLKDILETEGYNALVASNGREGLAILREMKSVGLILLDMAMPVMDGRTFLNQVKAEILFQHIPVVFLSGSVDETNTMGAVGVLQKPAQLSAVLDLVNRHYVQSPSYGF
jgi:predicted PurR-regulated permease PerM